MGIDVTILGSGSARPTAHRLPSSHAVAHGRHLFLVDCGEGTQIQMCRCGLSYERVDAIFLTHLHADHTLGIFGLIASMSMTGRRMPLHVFAHPDLEAILQRGIDFFIAHQNFEIKFHPVQDQEPELIYSNRRLTVTSIPLRHRIPTTGYLFQEKPFPRNIHKDAIETLGLTLAQIASLKRGESVELPDGRRFSSEELTYVKRQPASYAYLSDTLYSERAASFIKGVDLLYHEATYLHENLDLARQTGHSTARQAGQIAQIAEAQKLIIGHYSARYRDLHPLLQEAQEVFPSTVLAKEGEVHRVTWR